MSDLLDVLCNAQPIINFAFLDFLSAWISVLIYAGIIVCWYKSLRKYQKSHNNIDLLMLIAEPLTIIGMYISISITIGWYMYFMGVITFIILIVGCVIIPASMEYSNKYPKHSTELIKIILHDLKHPVMFLMHNNN